VARHQVIERESVAKAAHLRLVQRALDMPTSYHGGEIQHSPWNCRDGNAPDGGDLVERHQHKVKLNARARMTSAWNRGLDAGTRGRAHPPELRRRPMTQHRPLPAHEDGSHPARFHGEDPVADCVDAAVDRVQRATLQPVVDNAPAEPHFEELRSRDHAVLTIGQLGYHAVAMTSSQFAPHRGVNCDLVGHLVIVVDRHARRVARTSKDQ